MIYILYIPDTTYPPHIFFICHQQKNYDVRFFIIHANNVILNNKCLDLHHNSLFVLRLSLKC